jgi:hypothetical protein
MDANGEHYLKNLETDTLFMSVSAVGAKTDVYNAFLKYYKRKT